VLWTCRVHAMGTVLALSAVGAGTTACTGTAAGAAPAGGRAAATTRSPEAAASALTGSPDVQSAGVAWKLFTSAPVVVVADAVRRADVALAAARAERAHAPVLLLSPAASGPRPPGSVLGMAARIGAAGAAGSAVTVSARVRAEIDALRPRAVLAVGIAANVLAAQLPGLRVVTDPDLLPGTTAPVPVHRVALLVHQGDKGAAVTAAVATAQVAGAQVIAVRGYDPRTDVADIAALAGARPQHVLAVGPGFGSSRRLAARVAVAETGVQLPGGGQVLFPAHRLVALYGHPGTPALGALGDQGLPASIARVRRVAAAYRHLSGVPVIPAFEIIATVAQARPGTDGTYSYESSLASLRPWVRQATAAGLYVVLDLQPGRASLLGQARRYRTLLALPDVGLALDPEWKLRPGQFPLRQIGSVGIGEVNAVIGWLARLTARHHLPQKLLVLHQFQLSMIRGEQRLDTRPDNLAIVIHMDGQGSPADKLQTWAAVTGAAPAGVFFGWKNFYVKDHPVLDPRQTMARTPRPVMISYQ